MANRSWTNHNQDWDPMRDDYNDSTFEPQYPDDNAGGEVQLDQCRLYVTNIPKTLNEEGLRTAFTKYGTLVKVFLSRDQQKRFGLVAYETPGEAKLAMMKLNRTEPLKLNIHLAHKKKPDRQSNDTRDASERNYSQYSRDCSVRNTREGCRSHCTRDDNASVSSKGRYSWQQEDIVNGEGDMENLAVEDDLGLADNLNPDLHMELVQLKMEHLKLQQAQLQCKQRMLLLNRAGKKPLQTTQAGVNRCMLPDGRIFVRNINERAIDGKESDIGIGGGDTNGKRKCSCNNKQSWDGSGSSQDDSSSASTCVLCEERNRINRTWNVQDKSDLASRLTHLCREKESEDTITNSAAYKTVDLTSKESKGTVSVSKRSNFTSASERLECDRESETLYEFKFSDFVSNSDEVHDETNRLIHLRNTDYLDAAEEQLKIVIAPAGYPKSKMRLKQMEQFQRSLTAIIDMQLKSGLLKKVPSFLDYYLNRGAIVCICKNLDTRNWIVRVSAGLEERMNNRLILLNAKVKRICLAVLKIPHSCWPATALDVFKLLQYFNPTLKTESWKIYTQKIVDKVECTSFLIDRVSGEVIRGPSFKNVIDYSNMEFELTGYTEIYYEIFLTDLRDDISSVASRVKLLGEIRSEEITPRIDPSSNELTTNSNIQFMSENRNALDEVEAETKEGLQNTEDLKKDLRNSVEKDILKKLKDVAYVNDRNETIVWSDRTNDDTVDQESEKSQDVNIEDASGRDESTSTFAFTNITESFAESDENLIDRNSTVTIDSNRGVAYYRRTNYLHLDDELKIAITLEEYPQQKLVGTHIRRLKRLFKEYLHKDVKSRRFNNHIVPKFQDVYLSNGAVIYICDSLETKDYLNEILPKFVNSTGLKLIFKDIKDLLRYTRVVMRLPKELAHLESKEFMSKLQSTYPGLKLDCWKHYSDVAGKQKRQFGVDPQSVAIIKSPEFEFSYEGQVISFRIIDRKRRDVSFNEIVESKLDNVEDVESEALWEKISKEMYCPIDPDIMRAPLTRVRTNHYSDLVADDLKLYVGPFNYPETRVDEALFYSIKNAMIGIVFDSIRNDMSNGNIPRIHDMYLFDGVIFIICKDAVSKKWIEDHIPTVCSQLHINLKSTEFRGAVGIVSMVVKTDKDTDEVISILQKQNPRLRTMYWRKISIVRSNNKLDAVLQIDKLSAQVIDSPHFNTFVGSNPVHFKLGHLQSLIKSKTNLIYPSGDQDTGKLSKPYDRKSEINTGNSEGLPEKEIPRSIRATESKTKVDDESRIDRDITTDIDVDLQPHKIDSVLPTENSKESYSKMILKVPKSILPEDKEEFKIILDLLQNKNPGLNIDLWQFFYDPTHIGKGRFTILIDQRSAAVIKSNAFDSTLGGEKLKFLF